jgi:hypothetical protein
MEIAALVISLLALSVAGLTALYVKRQADATVDSAGHEARAADAAQESVSYRRDEVERGRVKFVLEPGVNHEYMLINEGTHSAYGVQVDTGCLGIEPVTEFAEFRDGQAESYLLHGSLGCTTKHVVVTWHFHSDLSDEPQVDRLLVR